MGVKELIERKLVESLQPVSLKVTDESHLHRGHAGWREGGETHFRVEIVSARFSGVDRIQRHRLVNEALKDEINGGVHALAIIARPPEE